MKQTTAFLVVLSLCFSGAVLADYSVSDKGEWPTNWPKELEALRERSRTFEGPLLPLLHYSMTFTSRDEFEAAWPHFVKLKTQGAPIVLRQGPSFWLSDSAMAGICIHTPPKGQAASPLPKEFPHAKRSRRSDTIYIELIVDGKIVDLNRIPLPPDTPIVDERFKDRSAK